MLKDVSSRVDRCLVALDTQPMPETNHDFVQRIYDEFNERLELPRWALDPEIDWWPPVDEPDNDGRHGADEVIAYVGDWVKSFADYRCEVENLVELSDRIAAECVLHGRIRGSDASLTRPLTQVWTVRDGLVTEVREYRTIAAAVAAQASAD
jgi:ketosteroid isomerase-like protein